MLGGPALAPSSPFAGRARFCLAALLTVSEKSELAVPQKKALISTPDEAAMRKEKLGIEVS